MKLEEMGMFMSVIVTLLLPFLSFGTSIKVDFKAKSHELHPQFLSFAVDMSQVLGKKWWSKEGNVEFMLGKAETKPFDFSSALLNKRAELLKPFYLRVGGSLSDEVYYDERSPQLGPEHLKKIFDFVEKQNSSLVLVLSANPKLWEKPKEALKHHARLLHTLKNNRNFILGFEYGNEVNVHSILYGIAGLKWGSDYGKEFLQLKQKFQKDFPKARWIMPGNSFWPIIGEWMSFPFRPSEGFLETAGKETDVVNWHFYPTQSRRCGFALRSATKERLMSPEILDQALIPFEKMNNLKERYAPQAKMWLGETGHAQCGGEPGLSSSFISTLWWVDLMGLMSRAEVEVVIRQTLAGGDYGLMDEEFNPRPDYWASVLWKKIIGDEVWIVEAKGLSPQVRVYGFKSRTKGHALVAINLADESTELQLPGKGKFWLLSEDNRGTFLINGRPPELMLEQTHQGKIVLPMKSIIFAVIDKTE